MNKQLKCNSHVKVTVNEPCWYANGLSCMWHNAGTLSGDTRLSWATWLSWKTVLLRWNDLLQELINIKAIITDFDRALLQLVNILNTLFIGSRHLSLKHEPLLKGCAEFYLLLVNNLMRNCLFTWKIELLKFKLLYLMDYISCFNKMYRICCTNTHSLTAIHFLYFYIFTLLKNCERLAKIRNVDYYAFIRVNCSYRANEKF